MKLQSRYEHDIHIITVAEDRIDAYAAIGFKDAMRVRTAEGPADVLLDLSQVNFVDSSGLGAIVAVMKQLGAARRLALAGLQPNVARVFHLTRMDSVFDIHEDIQNVIPRAG